VKIRAEWQPVPITNPDYQWYFDIDSDPDFHYCCDGMKNASMSGKFSEILWTDEISGQLMWKNEPITVCPWCGEAIEIERIE
jgi:hypothetical protein